MKKFYYLLLLVVISKPTLILLQFIVLLCNISSILWILFFTLIPFLPPPLRKTLYYLLWQHCNQRLLEPKSLTLYYYHFISSPKKPDVSCSKPVISTLSTHYMKVKGIFVFFTDTISIIVWYFFAYHVLKGLQIYIIFNMFKRVHFEAVIIWIIFVIYLY